ncbi:ribose-phosphate diphosphokinase [Candidatus Woesearchaeota archaeon]|nr:ribose-phosphate diphosphokinase [Candidatus Woesearchaeota archaeon]
MKKLIVGCSNSKELAKSIARHIKKDYTKLLARDFPDGELYLKYQSNIAKKEIILVQSMHPQPNKAMMEAIFAVKTAKELGAVKVTLVAPYLAYMRQDKRFHRGECKSNSIMAELLSCADQLITIDPHLHRVHKLSEIFKIPAKTLTANHILAQFIGKKYKNVLVIGPDEESYQWAAGIAKEACAEVLVLHKKRYSSRKVKVFLREPEKVKGKNVVLIDDIISSGHTMIEAVKECKKAKASSIHCICVHGIYSENALPKILKAGAKEVISTNTIQNKASKIDVSKLIADNF